MERRRVGLRLEGRLGEERLGLGGERDTVPVEPIVERLLARSVTREEQPPPAAIPQGEREHAAQPREALGPVDGVGGQQHLGIGPRPEAVAPGLELGAELPEVVDLPVADDLDSRVVGRHGLSRRVGQIHDGQTPVREPHRALVPDTGAVGAPVGEEVAHAAQRPEGRPAPRSESSGGPLSRTRPAPAAAGAGQRRAARRPRYHDREPIRAAARRPPAGGPRPGSGGR